MINFNDLLAEYGVAVDEPTNHDPPATNQRHTPQYGLNQTPVADHVQSQSVHTTSDTRRHQPHEVIVFPDGNYRSGRIPNEYSHLRQESPRRTPPTSENMEQANPVRSRVERFFSKLPDTWWLDCLLIAIAVLIAVAVIANLPEVLFGLACMIFSISKVVCGLILTTVAIVAGVLVIRWRISRRGRWRRRRRWI